MASIITAIGNAKLIAATPINPVTIKSIAVGSGTGPFDPNITALKNQVWIGDSSAPQKIGAQLRFTCHIPANVGGWTITEWGLIDTSGDLIAYGQLDEPIYKPVNLMSLEPVFIIELGDSSQADLVVTDTLNFDHNFLNNRSAADAHPISSITGLQQSLTNIQNDITTKDGQNVKLTGNQSIQGEKSFNDTIHFKTANNGAGQIMMDSGGASISANVGTTYAGVSCDGANGTVNITGQLTGDGSGLDEATTGKKGAVQLATSTEVASGTNATKAVTPSTYRASTLGWGQTWTDVTSSRALGTNYTNNTGRPIQVIVSTVANTSAPATSVTVSGVVIATAQGSESYYQGVPISFIVPNGAVYSVSGSMSKWVELR